MKNLLSDEVDKCEFEYYISSFDKKINIMGSCENKTINIKINNQQKGSTFIHENYKLLFDVPDDPLVKLDSALKLVRDNLRDYESLARLYLNNIDGILNIMDEYEDKEKRLKEEQTALEQEKSAKKNLEEHLYSLKKEENIIKRAHVVFSYKNNVKEFESLESNRKNIEKRIKKMKDAGIGGGGKKYHRLKQDFLRALSDLKFSVNNAANLERYLEDSEKKNLKKFAQQINSIFSPEDIDENKLKNWRKYIKYILLNEIEPNKLIDLKLPEEDELDLMEKFIDILEDFIETEVKIPGTGGKNVREFLTVIKKDRQEIEIKLSKKLMINRSKDECIEIIQKIGNVAVEKAKIPKIDTDESEDFEGLEEQKKNLKEQLNKITKNLDSLENEYDSIPEKEKILYSKYDERIKEEYKDVKNKINKTNDKIKDHDVKIKSRISLISHLKEVEKKPKFNKDKLMNYYNTTSNILQKLDSWLRYIDNFDLKKGIVDSDIDDDAEIFYLALSDYFAGILEVIFHEHKKWIVKKIDFINNCYIVEGRKPISFKLIGTGHTALNSLMAKLKQNYGGRKKIVLFDEIGLMDDLNLNLLVSEIRKQVKNGDILFCLLACVDKDADKVIFEPIRCN